MTQWVRCLHEGQAVHGLVQGDNMLLHDGSPWSSPQPTGQSLLLDSLQWLPPCVPGKIIGLLEKCIACRSEELPRWVPRP